MSIIPQKYFYRSKIVYCPNGFELDPNFEGQLQPIFDGHLLTRVFESCPEAIRKASECTLEKYCHEFNYNMDECLKGYSYQEVSCIKNNTGKSQGHAWSYLSSSAGLNI